MANTLQEIADQRTAAIKAAVTANSAEHAKQTAEYGPHARLQAVWEKLAQAALTPRCGDKAAQALPLVAQAIRDAGRLPRLEAAANNAQTEGQKFIAAIIRQALTGTVTAAEWNLYDGSLLDAQAWLYDQVAWGFWKDPAEEIKRAEEEKARRQAEGHKGGEPPPGTAPAAATAKPKARRRGTVSRKPKPLTPRQAEVVQVVGECQGVIAAAARQLGRDRKTIAEIYKASMAKIGKTVVRSHDKARLFQRDKRGQETVSDNDERF